MVQSNHSWAARNQHRIITDSASCLKERGRDLAWLLLLGSDTGYTSSNTLLGGCNPVVPSIRFAYFPLHLGTDHTRQPPRARGFRNTQSSAPSLFLACFPGVRYFQSTENPKQHPTVLGVQKTHTQERDTASVGCKT